jgi:hypothetical protein
LKKGLSEMEKTFEFPIKATMSAGSEPADSDDE